MDLGAIAGAIGGAIKSGAGKIASGVKNLSKSEKEGGLSTSDKMGIVQSISESFQPGDQSNVSLHPMAQSAMNLDMGFYGHMKAGSISKGSPIMGGINGPHKGGKNATRKGK